MRDLFPSFYDLSNDQRKDLWKEGVFVFDASALLTLTVLGKKPQQDALRTLNAVADRLWMAHQAALEFQANRTRRAAGTSKIVDEWKGKLEGEVAAVRDRLQASARSERGIEAEVKALADAFDAFERLLPGLDAGLTAYKNFVDNDRTIFLEIDRLFGPCVGPQYSTEQLRDALADADVRFKQQRPPGYLDQSKDRGGAPVRVFNGQAYEQKFGDLIIWKQLLEELSSGSERMRNVIFVTDDSKDDWWAKADGRRTGPRRELREEFAAAGGRLFWMYSLSGFLKTANEQLHLAVNPETIRAAREAAEKEPLLSPAQLAAKYGLSPSVFPLPTPRPLLDVPGQSLADEATRVSLLLSSIISQALGRNIVIDPEENMSIEQVAFLRKEIEALAFDAQVRIARTWATSIAPLAKKYGDEMAARLQIDGWYRAGEMSGAIPTVTDMLSTAKDYMALLNTFNLAGQPD